MADERLLDAARTCTNCKHSEVCWARIELQKIVDHWPAAGFVGAGAPGWSGDLFMVMASCCLLFEFKKLKK